MIYAIQNPIIVVEEKERKKLIHLWQGVIVISKDQDVIKGEIIKITRKMIEIITFKCEKVFINIEDIESIEGI